MRSTIDSRATDRTPAAATRMACGRSAAAAGLDASPRVVAQRQLIQRAFGPAAGAVAQRAISLDALNAKLDEVREPPGQTYQGTLDVDTTPDQANAVGLAWAGNDARSVFYGASAWDSRVSADGSKQYRPPMPKKSGQAKGTAQANYEAKVGREGGFNFNAHVTITGLTDHDDWKKKQRGEYKPPPKKKDPPDSSTGGSGDTGGSLLEVF